jgi:hypothetical protein
MSRNGDTVQELNERRVHLLRPFLLDPVTGTLNQH